jgi:hypothetical protein
MCSLHCFLACATSEQPFYPQQMGSLNSMVSLSPPAVEGSSCLVGLAPVVSHGSRFKTTFTATGCGHTTKLGAINWIGAVCRAQRSSMLTFRYESSDGRIEVASLNDSSESGHLKCRQDSAAGHEVPAISPLHRHLCDTWREWKEGCCHLSDWLTSSTRSCIEHCVQCI